MDGFYDLMLVLDSSAPEERREEILGQVRTAIESGGKLVGSHDWGTKRLPFEIDHRGEAGFHLFQFEGGNPLLTQLDRSLKLTDGVLRFRTIRLKPGSPLPPPPRSGDAQRQREPSGEGSVAPRAAADSRRAARESA